MNSYCLALALVLAPGAALAQDAKDVKLDYDHDVDFSRYKTFGWSVAQQPAKNAANHVRITRAVEEGMTAKGLTKDAAGAPDVFLMYTARVGDTVKVTGRPGGSSWDSTNLRTMVDLNKIREGTLVLEMYDAHTKEVVWRGVATEVGVQADEIEESIRAAVKKLLDAYPPRRLEAPKP
jgi:Domain of unknown function (DUF4136)